MANKVRVDKNGNTLRIGESQNKKDGRYCYKWMDKVSNKRRTIYALSLDELRGKQEKIKWDIEAGIDTKNGDMTFSKLFELYLKSKPLLKRSTKNSYRNLWNNYIKANDISSKKISKISKNDIFKIHLELKRKGMKYSSIKTCCSLLSSVLQFAVDSNMIRKNPCNVVRSNYIYQTRVPLRRDEQDLLVNFLKNDNKYSLYFPIVLFALNTGMRIGEIIGLIWDDIDLKNDIVHVRRQLEYLNCGDGYKFYIESPKGKCGTRDIPLTQEAKKALIKQKELDFVLGRRSKERPIEGIKGFVFITSNGTPILPSNFNNVLNNIVNSYNKQEMEMAENERREPVLLPHITAHILRHTFCTRFSELNLDKKVLQVIMGHTDVSMTLNVYDHVDVERMKNEMKKLI